MRNSEPMAIATIEELPCPTYVEILTNPLVFVKRKAMACWRIVLRAAASEVIGQSSVQLD